MDIHTAHVLQTHTFPELFPNGSQGEQSLAEHREKIAEMPEHLRPRSTVELAFTVGRIFPQVI